MRRQQRLSVQKILSRAFVVDDRRRSWSFGSVTWLSRLLFERKRNIRISRGIDSKGEIEDKWKGESFSEP